MLGKFGLAAAALVISAVPALADSCGSAPIAPAAIDGSKATEGQMKDAHDDVMSFIKASDDYQGCVLADLSQMKKAAAHAKDPKPLDQGIIDSANARVAANQREKEKVGAEFNSAVMAYKGAHPGK